MFGCQDVSDEPPPNLVEQIRDNAETKKPHFCLCEMPEGEYPKVRIFKGGVDDLARHIGGLEGKEIAVWAFFGIPLRFSVPDKGGHRYLYLPGEQEAVPIPLTSHEQLQVLDTNLIDLEFQADGWLGDPALTEPSSPDYYQAESANKKKKKKGKNKQGPKSEFDDEDEEEPV